jgi:hypothetical protein
MRNRSPRTKKTSSGFNIAQSFRTSLNLPADDIDIISSKSSFSSIEEKENFEKERESTMNFKSIAKTNNNSFRKRFNKSETKYHELFDTAEKLEENLNKEMKFYK